MEKLERVIKGAVAVFALLPGIGVLIKAIDVPPNLKDIYGQLILALGFISVLIVYLSGEFIRRTSRRAVIVLCCASTIVSVASLAFYENSYERRFFQVTLPDKSTASFVKPSTPDGELRRLLQEYDSNWAALIADKGLDKILQLVSQQNRQDELLLLVNYLTFFLPLIFAMLVGAWKVADENQPTSQRKSPEPV